MATREEVDKMIAENPDRYKLCKNGAVYDYEAKKYCAMVPENNPHSITVDNTEDMHERRREQTKLVLLEAIASGMPTWQAGLKNIAGAQVKLAKSWQKHGRASTEAARWLISTAGLGEQADKSPSTVINQVVIDDKLAGKLLSRMQVKDNEGD